MAVRFLFLIIFVSFPLAAQTQPAPEESENIVPITDYAIVGEGEETLVFIPCFSCRWKSFEPFMERNKELYKMLAVTLPGHGGTGFPDIPLNTAGTPWHDNAWRAVAQLMEENGITNAILVTHSFGTDIGVHLAAARPDLFAKFIALDSNPLDALDQGQTNMEQRLKTADEIRAQYMEPRMEPDAWINFNAARSIKDPERRLVYHGMFVSTEKEVVFQYWRENMLQDINPAFSGLKMPYYDIQTISAGIADQEQARENHLKMIEDAGVPLAFSAVFLYQSGHFIMEERPQLLDSMIKEIVVEGKIPSDWRAPEH